MAGTLRLTAFALLSFPALAQTTLVGAGYTSPQPVQVAPGQVAVLYLAGLKTPTGSIAATGLPLPTTLGGISATIHQTLPQGDYAVPLLAVNQMNVCSGAPPPDVPECTLTAVTVQIPFEVFARNPLMLEIATGMTDITFSQNGVAGPSFAISPVLDNVHVITDCGACPSVVAHADGNRVTASSPAKSGEIVVAYAFGLGKTVPSAKTGQAATPGLKAASPIALDFEFLPNAAALRPQTAPGYSPTGITPEFAGLTPGFVGLYQVNFQAPPVPAGTPACGNGIDSNLTVRIQGLVSYDGARMCVDTSAEK